MKEILRRDQVFLDGHSIRLDNGSPLERDPLVILTLEDVGEGLCEINITGDLVYPDTLYYNVIKRRGEKVGEKKYEEILWDLRNGRYEVHLEEINGTEPFLNILPGYI